MDGESSLVHTHRSPRLGIATEFRNQTVIYRNIVLCLCIAVLATVGFLPIMFKTLLFYNLRVLLYIYILNIKIRLYSARFF